MGFKLFTCILFQVTIELTTGNRLLSVQGTTASFTCAMNCSNRSNVTWSKCSIPLAEDEQIDPKSAQKTRLGVYNECDGHTYTSTLVIYNISIIDEDEYCCDFRATDKLYHKCTVLNVVDNSSVEIQLLNNSKIKEGENVTMVCLYSAHTDSPSQTAISWRHDRHNFDKCSSNTCILTNISRAFSGVYQCIVHSENVSAAAEIQISVLYHPDVSVIQFQNGSLFCNATGFPKNYTFGQWEHQTKDGKHLRFLKPTSGEILDLDMNKDIPKYKINGRYICNVSNGVADLRGRGWQIGNKDIILSGKPICIEGDKYIVGRLNTNVFLKSHVYSSNVSGFNWWKGDEDLRNSSKYTISQGKTLTRVIIYDKFVDVETNIITLEIKQSTENDFKIPYVLTIYNNIGNCTCKLTLHMPETFYDRRLLFYVVSTFFCTVLILISTAIYSKYRRIINRK